MGAEQSSTMHNAVTKNCSGCKNLGNKNTDTVSVDVGKIQEVSRLADPGKENRDLNSPGQMKEVAAAEKQRFAEDVTQKHKEVEERLRRKQEEEEEEEVRRKQKAVEEEAQRRAKEEEEARIIAERELAERQRQREQEEAEEQECIFRRQMEEEMRRKHEEEERERQRQKQQEAEEEVRLRKKEAEKNAKVQAFLEKSGFQTATDKKVKKGILSSSFSYPLHAAVEAKDSEAVELLLWAGADPSVENSKKQTPLQFAQKKNSKQGSHEKVIAALAA